MLHFPRPPNPFFLFRITREKTDLREFERFSFISFNSFQSPSFSSQDKQKPPSFLKGYVTNYEKRSLEPIREFQQFHPSANLCRSSPNGLSLPDLYSGATGPIWLFNEAFSLRRLQVLYRTANHVSTDRPAVPVELQDANPFLCKRSNAL